MLSIADHLNDIWRAWGLRFAGKSGGAGGTGTTTAVIPGTRVLESVFIFANGADVTTTLVLPSDQIVATTRNGKSWAWNPNGMAAGATVITHPSADWVIEWSYRQ